MKVSSKEWLSEIKEVLDKAQRLYLIPLSDEVVTARLEPISASLEAGYQQLGAAFVHNVEIAHSTLSMPYTMAYNAVLNQHWRRLYTAASIRASDVDHKDLDKVAEREASIRKINQDKLWEFIHSNEGEQHILHGICEFLLQIMHFGTMTGAVSGLVHQGTVLIWSTLEVLSRDMLELDLNRNPYKLADFAADADARKRYSLDRISLDVILASGLDLSDKMGSIVTRNADLSDLPGMKMVLSLLFPNSSALRTALDDRQLWELYQRRNLIVHRRGIVDRAYIDKTGEQVPVGTSIEVLPSDLDRYFECVIQVGLSILDCCPKQHV